MKQSTIDRMLKGQTSVAKKVYSAVPINEAWPVKQVLTELGRLQISMDHRRVAGCLNTLKESGLIKEPNKGEFIRVTANKHPIHPEIPETHQGAVIPVAQTGVIVDNGPLFEDKTKETPMTKRDPMDTISGLTEKMRDIAGSMTALADEFDDVACELAESVTMSVKDAEKLQQLKGLLKALKDE